MYVAFVLCFFSLFETESYYVALAGLGLIMKPNLASNPQQCCLPPLPHVPSSQLLPLLYFMALQGTFLSTIRKNFIEFQERFCYIFYHTCLTDFISSSPAVYLRLL